MLGFYFSPIGRITRNDFWLKYVLVLIGIGIAAFVADYFLYPETRDASNGPVGTIANFVTLWPQIALTTKRFHDRGMSGWWQLLFNIGLVAGVFVGYSALLELEAQDYEMTDNLLTPLLVGGGLFLVAGLVELVILGFLPGTKGRNDYGDDPLNPTKNVAEVFS